MTPLISVIEGTLLSGSITGVDSILGESSGATYELDTIGFTQDYFVKDPFEDNTYLSV